MNQEAIEASIAAASSKISYTTAGAMGFTGLLTSDIVFGLIGVLIGVCVAHVLVFIILSVVTLSQDKANIQAITTLLAATVAATSVGVVMPWVRYGDSRVTAPPRWLRLRA